MRAMKAHDFGVETVRSDGGKAIRVRVAGDVCVATVARLHRTLTETLGAPDLRALTIDFGEVTDLDTSGIATLSVAARAAAERGIGLSVVRLPEELRKVLDSMPYQRQAAPPKARDVGTFEAIGQHGYDIAGQIERFYDATTDTAFALARVGKGQLPPKGSVTTQAVRIGVDALPIVGLLSLLLGLVLAFQAADQLADFGASIYTADIVGIGMFREFGPILTGIVLAGRSGSAMAAELGTMRVNEEIDALSTMGIDPSRYLVLPRVLAITVVQPALTLLSDLIGAFGGLLIGAFYLGIPARGYLGQSLLAIKPADLVEGLGKSVVFAVLIGLIGCYFGMSVRGGATGVGRATTSAVVASIFMIIVTDSIFTTFSTMMR